MKELIQAARHKFRFPSKAGALTFEQLWDLPLLNAKTGLDLDSVAKSVNAELKEISEESFVSVTTNPRKPELDAKLTLIKLVIATKLEEKQTADHKAEQKVKKDKILAALAAVEDRELLSASREDLLKQLKELDV